MLMTELGFSPPSPDEEAQILARHARGELTLAPGRALTIPAAVLSADPLISYSGCRYSAPLGVAGLAGPALRERPGWFLLAPTWSIESDVVADTLRGLAVLHRRQSPDHQLIFVGNTPREVECLRARGEAAFFFNKTALTPEWVFRPLHGAARPYSAIYNAQLVPWKRHELTLAIPRCAFLFYRDESFTDASGAQAAIMARHAEAAPGHVFINRLDDRGVPIRLSHVEVNGHLNHARVGLCLSQKEGAMFSSMEYLLSGLPVVSTPSVGGRDVYYDPEYCWTVPPEARAVAEAAQALAARRIPRSYIRGHTVGRVEADRMRFLGLLNAILEESRSERRLTVPWPFRKTVTMQWQSIGEAVSRAVHGEVDGYQPTRRRILQWTLWRRALRRLKRRLEGTA